MKLGKAPGEDVITTDLLEGAGEILHKRLEQLFTQYIRKVPKNFCLGIVILLHKKGDKHDLGNYSPTTLLSNISNYSQAGFRSGYSTIDHLHAMASVEYNKPLGLAFVDYEKHGGLQHNAGTRR